MEEPQPFNPPQLVDPRGRPAKVDTSCPSCGASADRRVAATGFGVITPHKACSSCGHEFIGARNGDR